MSQEENKTNTKTQWMIFTVSTIALILLLVYLPSFFWVALPFQLTSFAYAMDWV
ncbi:MAG TPA: hypothetical protein PLC76_09070 [Saprospiraceae bacterium]|jgi:uncharacterized integral membrane protein|nr:hypothetical protein [Candidatus Parvibacillus calidus]MBX2936029.1 hypothetical protein [Saprospiraceae bacterium]MBX7179610.1 hypothetical protein [Saprospiraceae bacterium]MCB0590163.1 hypothetical protein [Saprospiraceae bacterium]MCC7148680.1 hypothetical protein [Saprospiraceae bacterium]